MIIFTYIYGCTEIVATVDILVSMPFVGSRNHFYDQPVREATFILRRSKPIN